MPPNATRKRMIDTAIRMFQEHGYHGLSWRKLVEEAGTPWGSIAHHFPGGKIELAVAAVEAGADTVDELIRYCFKKEDHPAKAVHTWFQLTAKHMEKSGFQIGCPVASIALSTTPQVPEISEASRQAFERWENTLVESLDKTITKSERRNAAKIIMTLLEGGIVQSRIGCSKTPLDIAGKKAEELVQQY